MTHDNLRRFYDEVYYRGAIANPVVSRHFRHLAAILNVHAGQCVLDVACGIGGWLLAVRERGAYPVGIDVSDKAIDICRAVMPDGEFHVGFAENLPFQDSRFHVVSCLGSLEHFPDPESALNEMVRVATEDAVFLILVPNAGFLTRRLGLYRGTCQVAVREDMRTLREWREIFEAAGLQVEQRWRDLHVLSWLWISSKRWYHIPLRAAQAILLAVWPLSWQYQVYHLCRKRRL